MAGYNYLLKFLSEEGFQHKDNGNYFSFKIQGANFITFKHENTPLLQIIAIVNSEGHPRAKQLEICNALNQKYIVKCHVDDDSDRVACQYVFKPNDLTTSEEFMEIFAIIEKAKNEFYEKLG